MKINYKWLQKFESVDILFIIICPWALFKTLTDEYPSTITFTSAVTILTGGIIMWVHIIWLKMRLKQAAKIERNLLNKHAELIDEINLLHLNYQFTIKCMDNSYDNAKGTEPKYPFCGGGGSGPVDVDEVGRGGGSGTVEGGEGGLCNGRH
jgi:hypothetical protein